MRQIRRGVFETNSSSVHSIAIPHKVPDIEAALKERYGGTTIRFHLGQYGWEEEEVSPADYLWTALYDVNDGEIDTGWQEYIEDVLDSMGFSATFETEYEDPVGTAYVDHGYNLSEFLAWLEANPHRLLKYLAGGRVWTGYDGLEETSLCFSATPSFTCYDNDSKSYYKADNPNYDEDEYVYFEKGN